MNNETKPILSAEVCATLREIRAEILTDPEFDMSWGRCIGKRLRDRMGDLNHLIPVGPDDVVHRWPALAATAPSLSAAGEWYPLFYPDTWPEDLYNRYTDAYRQCMGVGRPIANVAARAIDYYINRDGPKPTPETVTETEIDHVINALEMEEIEVHA